MGHSPRVGTVGQLMTETSSRLPSPSFILSSALFLFLFSVYLLTYSPRFHSSDGLAVFATAESLVRRGEWDADQIRWMGLGQGIFGPDGHLYVRKGVGMSLLALPLVWLGMIVPVWGAATTTLLFNALATSATGVLLLLYVRELGYDDWVALVAALVFGLATPAWPYAKTFFSDPLSGLCLIGAALALWRFRSRGHAVHALWAGLALSVAVAARYASAALLPLYGLLLIRYQISKSQKAGSKARGWQVWIAFGVPLLITAIGIAYYNFARYGDPFNTGYLPEESFSGVWLQGIAGLLVSPGRGLFLYAPVLVISLLAIPTFFRRNRSQAALAGAIIVAHLLLYGKWFMWHGGYAWGPRFMIPTLPFFVVGMAPAIERARQSVWWRTGLVALAVLSGLIQLLGLSVHFELFQTRLLDSGLPLFAPITFFALRYSPLLGQFQFLRLEYLDFAWVTSGLVNWPLLLALSVTVLLSGWALWRVSKKLARKNGRMGGWRPGEGPDIQLSGLLGLPTPILVAFSAILLVTAWLLAWAHALQPDDLRAAVAVLNERTSAADAVVTGVPDESPAFADLYKGRANVLGLSAGAPFDADTEAALLALTGQHPRLWWLPNWLPPEDISIERWLVRHGFRVEDRSFGSQRLVLFYFPPQPLVESQVGVVFGDSILLERVGTLPVAQAGGVLPVTLHWKARHPVAADYYVFVHLLDAGRNRVAQSDGQPALWTRPTSSWATGEPIEDRHALALPAGLPQGDYTLIAGLYLRESGQRLLTDDGQDHVTLGTLQIRE
ncbi:MAG: hypothetical protein Kow0063_10520 [Anaerolineae bacterium]